MPFQYFSSKPARLDKTLVALWPALSRARLQALISQGHVRVDGKTITQPSHKLKGGEEIGLTIPEAAPATPRAQKIALDIVFEDTHLLVLNKSAGLVVHPAAGHAENTLVNALLAHCGDSLSGIGGIKRPGIVHRLDKDTSGLMVVAKSDKAHQGLSAQFADHTLARTYHALVWGIPKQAQGSIAGTIGRSKRNRKKMAVIVGGKEAMTHYKVLKTFGTLASLVECRLQTGRTHQIRVHMAHMGNSVIGDPVYGSAKGHQQLLFSRLKKNNPGATLALPIQRQALHAAEIEFVHPATGKKRHFRAPAPDDFKALEALLKKST